MKQIKINLYDFEELSEPSKIKALEGYNSQNQDYDFMEDNLNEYLKELLIKADIIGDAQLYYSLSYCQGDGVCFTGDFMFKGINFSVRHNNNHYYHSNSTDIEAEIDDDDSDDLRSDIIEAVIYEAEADFKEAYKKICDIIEEAGYKEIEYNQSEENFKELCLINEYTFEKDGTMRDE